MYELDEYKFPREKRDDDLEPFEKKKTNGLQLNKLLKIKKATETEKDERKQSENERRRRDGQGCLRMMGIKRAIEIDF